MELMSGIDAKFLYSETPTAHMHTIKIAVSDVSSMSGGFSFGVFVSVLDEQLGRLPLFRRRIVTVPLALGHPVWIDDPNFNLAHHVGHRVLSAPGSSRQLAEQVADIASAALPRDRPLWSFDVIEGLAGGRIAVVAKVHHAVADGAAAVALLQNVVAGLGDLEAPGPVDPWSPEAIPSRRSLIKLALRQHVARLKQLPSLARRSVRGARASESHRRHVDVRPPLPMQTPRTSFNVSLSAKRTFAMATVELEKLKEVRRSSGATLNDVYLTVCGGAIRSYLASRHEFPEKSLVASVPVSIGDDAGRLAGNRVDNLYVTIGTDIADPVERLEHVRQVTRASKDVRDALGNELLEQRAEIVPPQLYTSTVRLWSRSHLADHLRPPINLVASNVPGPRETITFGDVALEHLYSVGPILEGIGLNLTAWSYVDELSISALGSPESLPDPWLLVERFGPALDELLAALGAELPRASSS